MSPKAEHVATANEVRILLHMKKAMNDEVGNEQPLPYNLELFISVKSKNTFFLSIRGNRNYISLEFGEK